MASQRVTAHLYCKRYRTERFVVEYSGILDIDMSMIPLSKEFFRKDLTLAERQSIALTCTTDEDFCVVALQEVTPGQLYVLKIPWEDAKNAWSALKDLKKKQVCISYVESMKDPIIVTTIAPNHAWKVDHDNETPNCVTISYEVFMTIVFMKEALMEQRKRSVPQL